MKLMAKFYIILLNFSWVEASKGVGVPQNSYKLFIEKYIWKGKILVNLQTVSITYFYLKLKYQNFLSKKPLWWKNRKASSEFYIDYLLTLTLHIYKPKSKPYVLKELVHNISTNLTIFVVY